MNNSSETGTRNDVFPPRDPDHFDYWFNTLWTQVMQVNIVTQQSVPYIQLYQTLLERGAHTIAYVPPEASRYLTVSEKSQPEPAGYAEALLRPAIARAHENALPQNLRRQLSQKIVGIASEAGVHVTPLAEPTVLTRGLVSQLVDIKHDVDSYALPMIFFIPENGYGSLHQAVIRLMAEMGEVSRAFSLPDIRYAITDSNTFQESAIVQLQQYGNLERFLITMLQILNYTNSQNRGSLLHIPLAQCVFDPVMIGLFGVDERTKDALIRERGSRWFGRTTLGEIYQAEIPSHMAYLYWHLHGRRSQGADIIARGGIPNFTPAMVFPSEDEKRYQAQLFSIGQLVLGGDNKNIVTPLLPEMEIQIATAINTMVDAWKPVIDQLKFDTIYSEMLYSLRYSSWFTALSYAVAHRERINELLHAKITEI